MDRNTSNPDPQKIRTSKRLAIALFFAAHLRQEFRSDFLHGKFGSGLRARICELNKGNASGIVIRNRVGARRSGETSVYWAEKRAPNPNLTLFPEPGLDDRRPPAPQYCVFFEPALLALPLEVRWIVVCMRQVCELEGFIPNCSRTIARRANVPHALVRKYRFQIAAFFDIDYSDEDNERIYLRRAS